MTELLREVFGEIAGDQPPMSITVADVVAHGRRRRTWRRRSMAAAIVAAILPIVGVSVSFAVTRPDAGPLMPTAPSTYPQPSIVDSPNGVPSKTASPPARPASHGSGAPSSPTGAPRNQLADAGFEHHPPGWGPFGPATTLTVTTTVHSGAQALRITTTSTDPVVAGTTSQPVQVVTVVGTRYTASCWIRATGRLAAYLQVQEYTHDWSSVAAPAKSPRVELDDPTHWYPASVSYTATTTGNLLPLTVFGADMTAGGSALLVDDCTLTSAS